MACFPDFDKAALWRDRFARFQSAEGSVARFCRDEGVSVASFYAWRKKLPAQNGRPRPVPADLVPSSGERPSPAFQEVRVLSRGSLTVALVGGTTLQIPTDDRQTLELALQTLVRSDARLAAGGEPC